jgi:hypothetical protein
MSLIVTALALIASVPQHPIDPGEPVTAELVDAGVFNWTTKTWLSPERAATLRAASLTVYNNTCTYTGGNNYDGLGLCTTFFDEGRVPSTTSPGAPVAATDDNLITSFEIAYCTRNATGTIDVKIGFYNAWGGCMSGLGGSPWIGPLSGVATAYFDFGAAAGYPLPGDPVPGGAYQCNKVTIALGNSAFCLASDGEGFYDNQPQLDVFAWSVESNTPQSGSAPGFNLVRAGEPSLSGVGGCTYNIPCGSDPSPWPQFGTTPQPCGHGLGTEDHWWINVDNEPWGGGQTGGSCTFSPGAGTACYWFGGNPGNPFASYWLVLGSAGGCSGCSGSPVPYCTAGTSTSGCTPGLSMAGSPSVTNAGPCTIALNNTEGQKTGLLFYGMGQQAVQWGTSTSFLCVKSPTQRLTAQSTGGTAGQCNGTFATDINQFFAANPLALGQPLFAGQVLDFQAWYRDPPSPKTTHLSSALSISMCP